MPSRYKILPSIVVKKIRLESVDGGSYDDPRAYGKHLSDNPHIREEVSFQFTNPGTGNKIKIALGHSDPKQTVHNVGSAKGLAKITATIMAKDIQQGKNNRPLWIQDDFVKQFIAINVVAAKSTKLGNDLLRNHIEKIIKGQSFPDLEAKKVRHFKAFLNETDINASEDHGHRQPGSLFSVYNKKLRKNVFEVPYEISFTIPGDQKDLILVVFASIDLGNTTGINPIVEKFGISPDKFDAVYSSPLIETVLIDGHAPGMTDYFVTPDNLPWTGPFHWYEPSAADPDRLHQGKYMTGQTFSAESVDLKKKRIQNYKVVDFRNIEKVTTPKTFDFSSIENLASQLNDKLRMASQKPLYAGKNISYMSPLYMTPATPSLDSLGSETDVRPPAVNNLLNNMFFVLDWRKLNKDNSLFPSLLDYPQKSSDMSRIQEILNLSKILSFSVYRRKILNKTENTIPSKIDIYEDEIPELIVQTMDRPGHSSSGLKPKIQTKLISAGMTTRLDGTPGDTKYIEQKMGSVREIEGVQLLSDTQVGMRFFTVTDASTRFMSAGKYQYFLKLRVRSGTHQYLINRLRDLQAATRALKKYQAAASKGFGRGQGSWDNIFKRFTDAFINKFKGQAKTWESPIELYLSCAQMLYQNSKELYSVEKIEKDLKMMCAVTTGSPKGISIVLNLIEDFIERVTKILGGTMSLNKEGLSFDSGGALNKTYVSHKPTTPRRVFEYEYGFTDIYELDFVKSHTGFEYLGSRQTNTLSNNWQTTPGLKKMSRTEYSTRVMLEERKYIRSGIVDGNSPANRNFYIASGPYPSPMGGFSHDLSNEINIHSAAHKYLTPSAVKFTGPTVDLLVGQYAGHTLTDSDFTVLSRTGVASLLDHILAGSYSSKTAASSPDRSEMNDIQMSIDSYVNLLEKYNIVVVPKVQPDFSNYILHERTYREDSIHLTTKQKYFVTDSEGNEIINPAIDPSWHQTLYAQLEHEQQKGAASSTGAKYNFGSQNAAIAKGILRTAASIVKEGIFSDQIDIKSDYYFGENDVDWAPATPATYTTSRMIELCEDKGKLYVDNLPLSLLAMLLDQGPGQDILNTKVFDTAFDYRFPRVWMRYKNIVSVEVLIDFADDKKYIGGERGLSGAESDQEVKVLRTRHVSALKWQTLSLELLDKLVSAGSQEIICRLKRYYNNDFNVKESVLTTEIPILNEYFTMTTALGAPPGGPELRGPVSAARTRNMGTY